jgi:hypothetical protein
LAGDVHIGRREFGLRAHTDPIDFVLHARAARILLQRRKIPSRRPAREPVIRANQSEGQKTHYDQGKGQYRRKQMRK